MKYTRYDYKKKRSEGTLYAVIIVSIIVLAFLVGTLISNMFPKSGSEISNKPGTKETNSNSIDVGNNNIDKLMAIQGGVFTLEKNAEDNKKLLQTYGNPFTVKESDGKLRVILGIYSEEEALKLINTLNEKGINTVKILFNLDRENLCNAEIAEIISADMKVFTKASEKEVKSVLTDDLKKWCSSLKDVDKNSNNYEALVELKTYINNLPKEITKNQSIENNSFIYNILKKVEKK